MDKCPTKTQYETLAYIAYRMFEGDDQGDELLTELRTMGMVDEDGEWIYDEE